jgi:hypothetical protein
MPTNSTGGPDGTLTPAESLDSDEVRNRDGDEVVEPPETWIEPREDESLDERLAAEEPDAAANAPPSDGQIDGTPEDGDSFFPIAD